MNFLSHLLLSGHDESYLFGNFIGDAVKGNKYLDFPVEIQKGILLHRKIDTFTDHHEIIKEGKQWFRPIFGHYRGVILDVFNDHFLSLHWHQFHNQDLPTFLYEFEIGFHKYKHLLEPQTMIFFERFIERKYMSQYDTFDGIELILQGMERKIGQKAPLSLAINDLVEQYTDFERVFFHFFPIIQDYCKIEREKLDLNL
jgi:acyl carrier protein phosphodiesterase